MTEQQQQQKPTLTLLPVPVPPRPILEAAIGYEYPSQDKPQPRFVAFSYQGSKPYYEDGVIGGSGHWDGYSAYIWHPRMSPILSCFEVFHFGSDDGWLTHKMVLDVDDRKLYAALERDANFILHKQWPLYEGPELSPQELKEIVANITQKMQDEQEFFRRNPKELARRIEESRLKRQIAMGNLYAWLKEQPTRFTLADVLKEEVVGEGGN